MESSSVQQRAATKRSKSKKKPIKVVYISNPMRVKASASEFRALVQELTGQDAELPPDLSKFHRKPESENQTDSDNSVTKSGGGGHESDHGHAVAMPQVDPDNYINSEGQVGSSLEREGFEAFDHDVFTPEMIDNISAFLPPAIFYESAQLDEVLRMLDADSV